MARKLQSITRKMTLGLQLTEARSNLSYWTRQCELRTDPDAQIEAGLQMVAWKGTTAALQSEMDSLKHLSLSH